MPHEVVVLLNDNVDYSELKDHIKLFLEGKLSESEEDKLLEWIKQSPDNKKHFYSLQQSLEEEFNITKDKEVSLHWERFLQRIDPRWKRNENLFKRSFKGYYHLATPVAAAFIVGFIIAILLFWKTDKPGQVAVIDQKISTPYGARTKFMLPDSSLVWLNSGSELLFPSEFDEVRPVTLRGEAYFEIKKGKEPFIVSTTYGDVEVHGTRFNVKAYHDDDFFETTLVSGKVNVMANNREQVVLRPGYQAVYTDSDLRMEPVETAFYTSWIEGRLIFRKESLPQLAARLERWYNVTIELDNDPRLKGINYTGTIEMETFSEVLNLLSVTAPVDYTWDDKTRIIRIFYNKNN